METIIEIVVGLFEIIIDCIESKLYKRKKTKDNDSEIGN